MESLLLRRSVSGLANDRLVARLCRAREDGQEALERAVSRIMPSDERVRVALKYGELPHPFAVLTRLAGVEPEDVDLEHVFPLAPGDAWSGDGAIRGSVCASIPLACSPNTGSRLSSPM